MGTVPPLTAIVDEPFAIFSIGLHCGSSIETLVRTILMDQRILLIAIADGSFA